MTPVANLTYRKAMQELGGIVTRLRTCEEVDVDDLVKDVDRAKTLIDFCGKKIAKAKLQIQNVVEALKPGAQDAPSEEAPPEERMTSRGEEEIPF